ncbi:MAG: hypothetical protein PHQ75_13270 [Thermoguttaceae bacterium]|nr:hypothetical protein [Thermoguttaceae bacterium]
MWGPIRTPPALIAIVSLALYTGLENFSHPKIKIQDDQQARIGMCHAKPLRRKEGKKMFSTYHDKKTNLFKKYSQWRGSTLGGSASWRDKKNTKRDDRLFCVKYNPNVHTSGRFRPQLHHA